MAIVGDHPLNVDRIRCRLVWACLECVEESHVIVVPLGLIRCNEKEDLIQICRHGRVDVHGGTNVDEGKYKALPVPISKSPETIAKTHLRFPDDVFHEHVLIRVSVVILIFC
jgi:hypothetical protein